MDTSFHVTGHGFDLGYAPVGVCELCSEAVPDLFVLTNGSLLCGECLELLEQYRRDFERACPLGRIGAPSDAAGAAIFLASRAAAWVNGVVLPVDGGLSVV